MSEPRSVARLIDRDFGLIISARLLRAFGFGMSAVLIGLVLEGHGFNPGAIGLVLTLGLLSAAIGGVVAAGLASRIGRRWTLAGAGLLMAITGADLTLATSPILLAHGGCHHLRGRHEEELGLGVHETPDQPRARDPIDIRICARDPLHLVISN